MDASRQPPLVTGPACRLDPDAVASEGWSLSFGEFKFDPQGLCPCSMSTCMAKRDDCRGIMTHLYMMGDYVILICNFDKQRLSIRGATCVFLPNLLPLSMLVLWRASFMGLQWVAIDSL